MIRYFTVSLVCLVSFLVLPGCGTKKNKPETKNDNAGLPIQETTNTTGKNEYVKFCLTCHQPDGNGVRSQFPPLAGNELVTGKADTLIRIVLNGLEGPITVKSQQYGTQIMPAQDYLTDQQIADVLSYIRNTWGNEAPEVTAEEVERMRDER